MYVFVYVYIYIYIYTYTCLYLYIYIYIYIHMCIHTTDTQLCRSSYVDHPMWRLVPKRFRKQCWQPPKNCTISCLPQWTQKIFFDDVSARLFSLQCANVAQSSSLWQELCTTDQADTSLWEARKQISTTLAVSRETCLKNTALSLCKVCLVWDALSAMSDHTDLKRNLKTGGVLLWAHHRRIVS